MVDNRAAFERFVEVFYTQKRVREAFDFLVASDYRRHNPNIPDGRFENGRIVEHWDVLQPVPEHPVHDHPMF